MQADCAVDIDFLHRGTLERKANEVKQAREVSGVHVADEAMTE